MSNSIEYMGKILIIVGAIIAASGVLLLLFRHTGIPLGKLPGDILIQRKNFTFYFPIVTSIILSILLTLIFWLVGRK